MIKLIEIQVWSKFQLIWSIFGHFMAILRPILGHFSLYIKYQAPKYGVTDTDRLPHRLPALKSRRTIFRFNVKLQNRLSRSVRLPKNRFRLPENRFRVASQTDYFKIGYLNRFSYLKNRFGYLKIGSVT